MVNVSFCFNCVDCLIELATVLLQVNALAVVAAAGLMGVDAIPGMARAPRTPVTWANRSIVETTAAKNEGRRKRGTCGSNESGDDRFVTRRKV
jgi:hypothetical protein